MAEGEKDWRAPVENLGKGEPDVPLPAISPAISPDSAPRLSHKDRFSNKLSIKTDSSTRMDRSLSDHGVKRLENDKVVQELMQADIGDWISTMLGLSDELNDDNFWDEIKDGHYLCQLVAKVCDVQLPKLKSRMMCKRSDMFCRDNIMQWRKMVTPFLRYDTTLFEVNDLVDLKGKKQVITCLVRLSKNFYNDGLLDINELPEFAGAELEVDTALESDMNSPMALKDRIDEGSCIELIDEDTPWDDLELTGGGSIPISPTSPEAELPQMDMDMYNTLNVVSPRSNDTPNLVAEHEGHNILPQNPPLTRSRLSSTAGDSMNISPRIKPSPVEKQKKRLTKKRRKTSKFRYVPKRESNIDKSFGKFIRTTGIEEKIPIRRVKPGAYVFGDMQRTVFVRELRTVLMVRVGGGWMQLGVWLRQKFPDMFLNTPRVVPKTPTKTPKTIKVKSITRERIVKKKINGSKSHPSAASESTLKSKKKIERPNMKDQLSWDDTKVGAVKKKKKKQKAKVPPAMLRKRSFSADASSLRKAQRGLGLRTNTSDSEPPKKGSHRERQLARANKRIENNAKNSKRKLVQSKTLQTQKRTPDRSRSQERRSRSPNVQPRSIRRAKTATSLQKITFGVEPSNGKMRFVVQENSEVAQAVQTESNLHLNSSRTDSQNRSRSVSLSVDPPARKNFE